MPRAVTPKLTPPRPELAALLDAVRVDPEADDVRLVLADWLEEQPNPLDRERGELVRAQVHLHRAERTDTGTRAAHALTNIYPRLSSSTDALRYTRRCLLAARPDLAALDQRVQALTEQHADVWTKPLANSKRKVEFHRGTLSINCAASNFSVTQMTTFAPSELACWLNRLALQSLRSKALAQFVNCPMLARLNELDLSYLENVNDLALSFSKSAHLEHLRTLLLAGSSAFCSEGMQALGATLPSLSQLRMGYVRLDSESVEAMTEAPWFSQLELLDVSWTGLDADQLQTLFNKPLPHLRWLILSGNSSDKGVWLDALPRWQRLTGLAVFNNDIGSENLQKLLAWPGLAGITALDLGRNNLTTKDAEAIADCELLSSLQYLSLGGNTIGDKGLRALIGSPYLNNLGGLSLWGNGIKVRTARLLLNRDNLPGLGFLYAGSNSFSEKALEERFPHPH